MGIIEIDGVQIRESPDALKELIQELAQAMASKYGDIAPGEIPAVKAVRALFHRTGLDPTRYRASSEALLRRVAKKKGLYLINSAVDVVNYFSLKTLLPMGLYDARQVVGPIRLRVGKEGETYEGIGRDMLNLARFPVLADSDGPFGSPISDSMRTRVTETCSRLLWITFAPAETNLGLREFADTMIQFNGGALARTAEI